MSLVSVRRLFGLVGQLQPLFFGRFEFGDHGSEFSAGSGQIDVIAGGRQFGDLCLEPVFDLGETLDLFLEILDQEAKSACRSRRFLVHGRCGCTR